MRLSEYLGMPLAAWIAEPKTTDQWSKVEGLRSVALRPRRPGADAPATFTHPHDDH